MALLKKKTKTVAELEIETHLQHKMVAEEIAVLVTQINVLINNAVQMGLGVKAGQQGAGALWIEVSKKL